MSEQKLTDWFPVNVKPSRLGVYQTVAEGDYGVPFFQYWNGSGWMETHFTVESADLNKDQHSSWQKVQWRGLASDPNA